MIAVRPGEAGRGRWRPTLRAMLYLIAFVLASNIAQGLVYAALSLSGLGWLFERTTALMTQPIGLVFYLAGALATVLVTWLFARFLDRRRLVDYGLAARGAWLPDLGVGFGLGVLLMALIFVVEVGTGWYHLAGFGLQQRAPGALVGMLLVTFVLFVMVAFVEELSFRGYILQNLELDWGVWPALIGSSFVFASLHLLNPGAGPISTFSLVFAGLLLGMGYLVTRGLWLPMGLHLSWNYFQGPVFGFPVSGNETGGVLVLAPQGPPLLTGAQFGPEASLVGVAVEILGIALLWLWASRRARAHRERIHRAAWISRPP